MKAYLTIALCVGIGVLTGCNTIDSRIRKNADLFAAFPPETQGRIKQGVINISDTKDMVFIALGAPRRVYQRQSAQGATEVWAYTEIQWTQDYYPLSSSILVRDRYGRLHRTTDIDWAAAERAREYDVRRVEFENNRVKAFEVLK